MSDTLTVQICDFTTPSKGAVARTIDRDSVQRVINSEEFRKNLKAGRVISTLTHSPRYDVENPNIPMEDQVLISPYLAGWGKKAWIDNDKDLFMGEVVLADNDNGHLIKDMLKKGFAISTSMSVSAKVSPDGKKYVIEDILSLADFTLRPALNAKVVKMDFSEKRDPNGNSILTFSQVLTSDKYSFSEESKYSRPTLKKGIHREGEVYASENDDEEVNESEIVNIGNPAMVPEDELDIDSLKPVPYTRLDKTTPHITNLNGDVAGVETENITPQINLSGIKDENVRNAIQAIFTKLNMSESDDPNVTEEQLYEGIEPEYRMSKEDLEKSINTMNATNENSVTSNFSLLTYIKDLNRPPHQVLKNKIMEVIQLCRMKNQDFIDQNITTMKTYFDSYILTWINQVLGNPNTEFNIGIGLRLSQYNVDPTHMRQLNLVMKKVRTQLLGSRFMTKPVQEQLMNSFKLIEADIYKYIDDKIGTDKHFIEPAVAADKEIEKEEVE